MWKVCSKSKEKMEANFCVKKGLLSVQSGFVVLH